MLFKSVVFFCGLLILSQSAFSFTDNPVYKKAVADFQASVAKDKDTKGMSQRYAAQFIAVHTAFAAAKKDSKDLPKAEDIERIQKEGLISLYTSQCARGNQSACDNKNTENVAYSKKYPDSKFTPQTSDTPSYDAAAKTMIANGISINLAKGDIVTSAPPVAAAKDADKTKGKKAKDGEAGGDKEDPNVAKGAEARYEATCEWSDLPRKILRGPGCYTNGTRICSGYVKCKGKKKYERLATCSESLCGDDQATACAKQMGYGSKSTGVAESEFTNSVEDKAEKVAK